MERLNLRYQDACRALATLESALREPFSIIVRDAAIQRFEYRFEIFWKFLKDYLKEKNGTAVNSPKACFRELPGAGVCSENEVVSLLAMTDCRNETSHTYNEAVAQNIYSQLEGFRELMSKILNKSRP
ncbi:MAG: nucleotidyltransferase substrate binding protein [Candidatus Omnitrophica bacterium]|nr:nucleotidyltransferase substrate binding protein [Candidatus Omnitrophota bacterium]